MLQCHNKLRFLFLLTKIVMFFARMCLCREHASRWTGYTFAEGCYEKCTRMVHFKRARSRSLTARRRGTQNKCCRGELVEVAAHAAESLIADGAWIRNDIAGGHPAGGGRRGAPALGMPRGQGLERRGGRHAGRIRQISLGAATCAGADADRLALGGLGAGRAADRITYAYQQAGGILVLHGKLRGRRVNGGRRCSRHGIDCATAGAAQEQDQE
jgi:hypothetical protein